MLGIGQRDECGGWARKSLQGAIRAGQPGVRDRAQGSAGIGDEAHRDADAGTLQKARPAQGRKVAAATSVRG